jgi:hypothetical protein
MKKFSKILESNTLKKYFKVECTLTLYIESENEGEAGYLSDSILGSIKEQTDFSIMSIEDVSEEEYKNKITGEENGSK